MFRYSDMLDVLKDIGIDAYCNINRTLVNYLI